MAGKHTILKNLIALMRPHQYTKNLFIFLPLFFAFRHTEVELIVLAVVSFIAFSLTAGGMYILNDWFDREEDKLHPKKKNRPIASGKISASTALMFMGILLIAGSAVALFVSPEVFYLIVLYIVLNIAYSARLKHIPIIDISVVSSGFVIRLMVGGIATGVFISHWIIIMTFLLALFLALAKRRDDVLIFLRTQQKTRKLIDGYTIKFLDSAMIMSASVVLLAYILWSISPDVTARLESDRIYLTAVFVVIGILRYMQIAFVDENSGNPTEVLLHDRFLQLILIGWIGSFVWLLYL